jgi:hypothetical protein
VRLRYLGFMLTCTRLLSVAERDAGIDALNASLKSLKTELAAVQQKLQARQSDTKQRCSDGPGSPLPANCAFSPGRLRSWSNAEVDAAENVSIPLLRGHVDQYDRSRACRPWSHSATTDDALLSLHEHLHLMPAKYTEFVFAALQHAIHLPLTPSPALPTAGS